MAKNERLNQILELLNNTTYVSANKLSKLLFVSLPTIRRDLSELEKRGLILRNYGGARKIVEGHYEIPLDFRSNIKVSEKKALCKKAAEFIKENSVIFVDGSSTLLQIADFIDKKKNVLVVTNGLRISFLLAERGINTISTGGKLLENSLVYAGEIANKTIENFNFDAMLFSSYGIDNKSIYETTLEETVLKRNVFEKSIKKYYLCDGEKISLSSNYCIANTKNLTKVITNKSFDFDNLLLV